MAPLPDNDKTPDKNKQDRNKDNSKESQKDEKTLSSLNDRELKALLDEAINYKNPKDREGKSELFNDLLLQAEESERIARAASAGGSELVRHCNPAARRHRHSGGPRGRRYGGTANSGLMGRSVTERGTHGGSLDNLAKDELYEATCRRLRGGRKSSTSSSGASSSCGGNQVRVSARQREGGSLPCNVNSGETSRDFLEEAKRSKEMKDKDYTVVDIEKERLIENDLLARGFEERLIDGGGPSRGGPSAPVETHIVTAAPPITYTSKATIQIQQQSNRASNLDDPISIPSLDSSIADKKMADGRSLTGVIQGSTCQLVRSSTCTAKTPGMEEKKGDENSNVLHQTKEKKKNKQSNKNVILLKAEEIEGHKKEIINNVDQLLQFIEGTENNKTRPVQSKSKQLHKQHTSEDGGMKSGKKKHTKLGVKESGNNVAVEGRYELKKSNSLGEISGMKLDREFEVFGSGKNKQEKEEENVVLRNNKPSVDRARERRSWGNVEPHSFQTLYNASSMENLEISADNWEVTRPKKKSKKRRNSVSNASGARPNAYSSGVSSSVNNEDSRLRRAPSPELGISNAKTTRSMPHSEKSNDSSSDVDSVHSLPMDGPISYADIAKNSEKKKPSPEKQDRPIGPAAKEKSPQPVKHLETDPKNPPMFHAAPQVNSPLEKSPISSLSSNPVVLDVHSIKSFPAITGSTTKASGVAVTTTAALQAQNVTTTSDKAVQSTLSYEETFVREKTPTGSQKLSAAVMYVQESGPVVPVTCSAAGGAAPPPPLPSTNSKSNADKGANWPELNSKPTYTPLFPKEKPNKGVSLPVLNPSSNSKPLYVPIAPKEKLNKEVIVTALMNNPSSNSKPLYVAPKEKEKRNKGAILQSNQNAEGFFGAQDDGHYDLLLMRDSSHYAAQRMPPDIMDVSTIEKIQFMNCSGANSRPATPTNTSQSSTQVSYTQMPPKAHANPSDAGAHQGGGKGKRKKGGQKGGGTEIRAVEENVAIVAPVCDTNLEDSRMMNGGVSDETTFSSPEPQQPIVMETRSSESPPPVVILSGLPKDVPSGLVFGFDINEQLLNEDSGCDGDVQDLSNNNNVTDISIERSPCQSDEWVKRYKPPPNDRGPPKHNHDQIVSFVSAAWEIVWNEQIEFYSDGL